MTKADCSVAGLPSPARLDLITGEIEARLERLARLAAGHYRVAGAGYSIIDGGIEWFRDPVHRAWVSLPVDDHQSILCAASGHLDVIWSCDPTSADSASPLPLLQSIVARIPLHAGNGEIVGSLFLMQPGGLHDETPDSEPLISYAALLAEEIMRHDCRPRSRGIGMIDPVKQQEAIQRAQAVFLTDSDGRAAFKAMLSDLLALTDSPLGLLGEVCLDPAGNRYLRVGAMTDISWSAETRAIFERVDTDEGVTFRDLDSLLCAPLRTGEVLVSDNLLADPRRKGLPAGHPPLGAYLGIPIYSGEVMTGLIGLANRAGGYSPALARELAPLGHTLGTLIERRRLYAERKEHARLLEQAANFDPLTGLPNRRMLNTLFETELREARLRGGTVSVCFIDLDNFKVINDSHGHHEGDRVLKAAAGRIRDVVRAHDVVTRLSGDEFVALLRDVDHPRAYQRLLDALFRPLNLDGQRFMLSGSMGVTVYPDDNSDPDKLLRHADQAMYAAKEDGKNRYNMFDLALHRSRKETTILLDQVREGLRENQFRLLYQPKIGLERNAVIGFEALIRWQHPRLGLLAPHAFLPRVEYTELDLSIGWWVIEQALDTLSRLRERGCDHGVSVNISPMHFLSDTFVDVLTGLMAQYGMIDDHRLTLEILESTALENLELASRVVDSCKALGVRVSLDDFGTGYSALTSFRHLAVDEIKIDRGFVSRMLKDGNDLTLVQLLVTLARKFGRMVVAEGVEENAALVQLEAMGCHAVQGFYFSPPLALEDALHWSEQHNAGR